MKNSDPYGLRTFFDAIAPRYDFLNSLLSFRLDQYWRRKAFQYLRSGSEESILDLGVGTGKFLNFFLSKENTRKRLGLDFSLPMLRQARRRVPSGTYLCGDFHQLPFRSNCLDKIISAFALRSVKDFPVFIEETLRVLKDGGSLGLLCLTRPKPPVLAWIHRCYLRFYLPRVGGVVSGHPRAYDFLSASIQDFEEPENIAAVLRQYGYRNVEVFSLTFGVATFILARKKAWLPSDTFRAETHETEVSGGIQL